MKIIITGKDFQLTEPIKTYVISQAAKLETFRKDIQHAKFELDIERHHKKGENYRVEGWVYCLRKTFEAGDHAFDMRSAVDRVMEKLVRQIEQDKEKRRSARRRG